MIVHKRVCICLSIVCEILRVRMSKWGVGLAQEERGNGRERGRKRERESGRGGEREVDRKP